MSLFTNYPTIVYPLVNEAGVSKDYTITDITTRIRVLMSDDQYEKMTFAYTVQDGETPESLSNKFYKTMAYHWTVMHVNEIYDYVEDWCKTNEQLERYCINKYGDDMNSPRYVVDTEGNVVANGDMMITEPGQPTKVWRVVTTIDNETNIITTRQTKVLMQPDWAVITNYEYELNENEKKRKIRIVRPEFVTEYVRIYSDLLNKVVP